MINISDIKILAFCGLDGSGKTTQIRKLKELLELQGKRVLVTSVEYTPFNRYQDDVINADMIRYARAFEFVRHYLELEKEYKNYDYVLCDRHKLCHLAFGVAYGATQIPTINHIFSIIPAPDLTFYFDVDVNNALERIINRKEKAVQADETEQILTNAALGYEEIMNKGYASAERINANETIDKIHQSITEIIREHFGSI